MYSHGSCSCEDDDGCIESVSHNCGMESKHFTHMALQKLSMRYSDNEYDQELEIRNSHLWTVAAAAKFGISHHSSDIKLT